MTKLAKHQLDVGIVTNLDVVRARTRLAQHKAREQEAIQGVNTSLLRLKRVIGLPLETQLRLTDSLQYFDEKPLGVPEAIGSAIKDRIEMFIADSQVKFAQYQLSEANRERLPEIDAYGAWGQSAVVPNKFAHNEAQIAINLRLPIFEGGRSKEKSGSMQFEDASPDNEGRYADAGAGRCPIGLANIKHDDRTGQGCQ